MTTQQVLEESNAALRNAVETRLAGKTTVEMSPMVASLAGCKPAMEAATAALGGGCCEGQRQPSETYSEWTPPDYARGVCTSIEPTEEQNRRAEAAVAGFKRLVEEARPGREARAKRLEAHPSSQAFYDLCDSLKEMHSRKSADYGSAHDPLANIRNGADFVGIEHWRGAMVRLSDKVTRLATYCRTGRLEHEGVEDTLLDLASYSLLALLLHRETGDA